MWWYLEIKELRNVLLPNKHEKVYVPNEIFRDLTEDNQISTNNLVFLYTYYCMISYLFRYCKYSQGKIFNNEDIKEMLGYKRKYSGVDYLIKKGGVLDQLGYTNTIRDFPLKYIFDASEKRLEFEMYSELDKETMEVLNMPRNFSIKQPVKAFYKDVESKIEGIVDGTFFEIENTHEFNINKYIQFIEDGLGLIEFFVYQFLKHKCDIHKMGYNATYEQIEAEINIPVRTLMRTNLELEKFRYVQIIRDVPRGKETLPNTYRIKK